MSLRHVTSTTGFDGDGSGSTTTDCINDSMVGNDAGANVVLNSVAGPKLFAGCRVIAKNAVLDADAKFVTAVRKFDKVRRVP